MEDTLKKTCEWVKDNQKLLDRSSFIISHDPVSAKEICHQLFVHGSQTLVFDHLLADSSFKKTYLTIDPSTNESIVIGITKNTIPISHAELEVMTKLIELKLSCVVPIQKITYLPTGQKAILYGYCNGGDLSQRIAEKSLSKDEKKFITDELLKAVDMLHRHGIIHRDIKGSNILLTENADKKITSVLLSDFGESTLLDEPISLSNIEHSHAAPEANEAMEKHRDALNDWYQLQEDLASGTVDAAREERIDQAVEPLTAELNSITTNPLYDSWGLGLTIYSMWTDTQPEDYLWSKAANERNYAEIARLKRHFVRSLKELPEDVDAIIRGLLDNDINKRKSAKDF